MTGFVAMYEQDEPELARGDPPCDANIRKRRRAQRIFHLNEEIQIAAAEATRRHQSWAQALEETMRKRQQRLDAIAEAMSRPVYATGHVPERWARRH